MFYGIMYDCTYIIGSLALFLLYIYNVYIMNKIHIFTLGNTTKELWQRRYNRFYTLSNTTKELGQSRSNRFYTLSNNAEMLWQSIYNRFLYLE